MRKESMPLELFWRPLKKKQWIIFISWSMLREIFFIFEIWLPLSGGYLRCKLGIIWIRHMCMKIVTLLFLSIYSLLCLLTPHFFVPHNILPCVLIMCYSLHRSGAIFFCMLCNLFTVATALGLFTNERTLFMWVLFISATKRCIQCTSNLPHNLIPSILNWFLYCSTWRPLVLFMNVVTY